MVGCWLVIVLIMLCVLVRKWCLLLWFIVNCVCYVGLCVVVLWLCDMILCVRLGCWCVVFLIMCDVIFMLCWFYRLSRCGIFFW